MRDTDLNLIRIFEIPLMKLRWIGDPGATPIQEVQLPQSSRVFHPFFREMVGWIFIKLLMNEASIP